MEDLDRIARGLMRRGDLDLMLAHIALCVVRDICEGRDRVAGEQGRQLHYYNDACEGYHFLVNTKRGHTIWFNGGAEDVQEVKVGRTSIHRGRPWDRIQSCPIEALFAQMDALIDASHSESWRDVHAARQENRIWEAQYDTP